VARIDFMFSDAENNYRVTVTRIGVFDDELAYGHQRGIYIIRHLESGKEFLGVSGIGITETARHSSGKTTVPDER
jgi:hypothetical protein